MSSSSMALMGFSSLLLSYLSIIIFKSFDYFLKIFKKHFPQILSSNITKKKISQITNLILPLYKHSKGLILFAYFQRLFLIYFTFNILKFYQLLIKFTKHNCLIFLKSFYLRVNLRFLLKKNLFSLKYLLEYPSSNNC